MSVPRQGVLLSAIEVMQIGPVIPVIVIDRIADTVPMARALVAGGVRVLELTLRTPVALQAIERVVAEVEGAIVGAARSRGWGTSTQFAVRVLKEAGVLAELGAPSEP
jgi:2-dehydro-3-deoxyphosphogluconate aldolase/(4S)-4-hydroxy-2-oxoglutarate aldolase